MQVKPYYDDGQITLYCGDNREVLPRLGAGVVDLVITSPPYNLGISSGGGLDATARTRPGDRRGGRDRRVSKWGGCALAAGYGGDVDALPWPEYTAWQQGVLRECWRVLSERGAVFYNHKPRIQAKSLWTPLDLNPGLPVRQVVIWSRPGGVNFNRAHYCPTHEWVVVFARPGFALKSQGASGVGDVWTFRQDTGNPHPASFPVQLPATILETTGAAAVLDPHAGSGTTLLAAKHAGIRAVGIEKNEAYCEMAVCRLAGVRRIGDTVQHSLFSLA